MHHGNEATILKSVSKSMLEKTQKMNANYKSPVFQEANYFGPYDPPSVDPEEYSNHESSSHNSENDNKPANTNEMTITIPYEELPSEILAESLEF